MKRENIRNAYLALALLLGIIIAGVTGYMLIEKLTFTEAFFMTVKPLLDLNQYRLPPPEPCFAL